MKWWWSRWMSLPETQVMKVSAVLWKLHKAQMVMGVVADEDVDWGISSRWHKHSPWIAHTQPLQSSGRVDHHRKGQLHQGGCTGHRAQTVQRVTLGGNHQFAEAWVVLGNNHDDRWGATIPDCWSHLGWLGQPASEVWNAQKLHKHKWSFKINCPPFVILNFQQNLTSDK